MGERCGGKVWGIGVDGDSRDGVDGVLILTGDSKLLLTF